MMKRVSVVLAALLLLAACGGNETDDSTALADSSPRAGAEAESATAEDDAKPVASEPATDDTDTTKGDVTTDPDPDVEPSDARVLLRQAVEEYVAAFGNGDPDAAVSLLSKRCTDTIPISEYRAAVAAAGELYPGLVVDDFYDIVLDGDRAVVYYYTDPEIETEDGERWIAESGGWVWDDC